MDENRPGPPAHPARRIKSSVASVCLGVLLMPMSAVAADPAQPLVGVFPDPSGEASLKAGLAQAERARAEVAARATLDALIDEALTKNGGGDVSTPYPAAAHARRSVAQSSWIERGYKSSERWFRVGESDDFALFVDLAQFEFDWVNQRVWVVQKTVPSNPNAKTIVSENRIRCAARTIQLGNEKNIDAADQVLGTIPGWHPAQYASRGSLAAKIVDWACT